MRFTQADLDRVPEPRVVRALELIESPAAVDGSPYRTSVPCFVEAVLADGDRQRVLLSDLRLGVVGQARHPVVDLYGNLDTPLRLIANMTNLRGTGVPCYQRSAALTRFTRWLAISAPHVHLDRGFKVEVARIETSRHLRGARWRRRRIQLWDRWSRRAWAIHRLRGEGTASEDHQRQHQQRHRSAPAA